MALAVTAPRDEPSKSPLLKSQRTRSNREREAERLITRSDDGYFAVDIFAFIVVTLKTFPCLS